MINKAKLLLGDYIDTEKFGRIYLPQVRCLKKCGENKINEFYFPFKLTLDILNITEEEKKK